MTEAAKMSPNRPYLIRAMYDWISDNGLTPYLLVDARHEGVLVPSASVKDGQIVLNVAARAVSELDLGNDRVRFMARFQGVSQSVDVPVAAVMAIYAQENGQGMMFPADTAAPPPVPAPEKPGPAKRGPQLRVVK